MKRQFFLLFCVVFFATTSSFTQTDTINADFRSRGFKEPAATTIAIEDPDLINLMMPVIPGIGSNSIHILSEQSVKPYLMPPRKVGKFGTSTSYALAALMEFYVNFDHNFKDNLSPDYIALNTSSGDLEKSLKFLAENGTVSAAIMPYDATAIPTAVFATQKYKISQYLHLFRQESEMVQKVFEIRRALMRGNPVLIEMLVTEEFTTLKNVRNWRPYGEKPDKTINALIVSYDQDLEAFEIYGSWGKEWGSNGYLWVDYDYIGKYGLNGYVVIPGK